MEACLQFSRTNQIYKRSDYTSLLHFLQILILSPPEADPPMVENLYPILVIFPQDLQTKATLDALTALSLLIIWPFCPCFFALTFFFIKFKPSTTTLSMLGMTMEIFPVFPRSFPFSIIILSPFRNFIVPVPTLSPAGL